MDDRPIGVFDSGVGGLTVLRALRSALPGESFIYLGDTARLPYGTKSSDTVRRYALQAARHLVDRRVKMLVIACNTASSVALEALRERWPDLPVMGVVAPGATAACEATRSGKVGVLATPGTVAGGAYEREIARRDPSVDVLAVACPVFVALAEEGWGRGPVARAAVAAYLEPLSSSPDGAPVVDTVVLGCTHFPALRSEIEAYLGEHVTVVDSAQTTALAVGRALLEQDMTADTGAGPRAGSSTPIVRYLATDEPATFARSATPFLGEEVSPGQVERIDL